jgi:hypothetical protein
MNALVAPQKTSTAHSSVLHFSFLPNILCLSKEVMCVGVREGHSWLLEGSQGFGTIPGKPLLCLQETFYLQSPVPTLPLRSWASSRLLSRAIHAVPYVTKSHGVLPTAPVTQKVGMDISLTYLAFSSVLIKHFHLF